MIIRIHFHLALLGVLLFFTALTVTSPGGAAPDAAPLKLTMEILSQKYCRDNDKSYTTLLNLHMHFVNQSNRKLIIEKSAGLGEYTVFIARDAKTLSDRNYEYSSNALRVLEWLPSNKPDDLKVSGDRFVILAPGEQLKTESQFGIWQAGRQREADEVPHTLSSGDHVMDIYVESSVPFANPEEIRKRWEPFGELIFANVMSEPFTFTLPPNPKLDDCKQR
jgi:hypothetical protein